MKPVQWMGALTFALVLSSCAGFRSTVRGVANDNMTGDVAPQLQTDSWLLHGEDVARPDLKGSWHMLVFFKPT